MWASSSTTASCGCREFDRAQIHLCQRHAAIRDVPQRYAFEVADAGHGVRAAVRLDETDHDVHALAPQFVGVLKHAKRLADARSCANIHTQPGAPLQPGAGEQRLGDGRRCFSHRLLLHRMLIVERQVELENVDDRLAEKAELTTERVEVYQAAQFRLGNRPLPSHSR